MAGFLTNDSDSPVGLSPAFPLLITGSDPAWMQLSRATIGSGRNSDGAQNLDISRFFHETANSLGTIIEDGASVAYCAAGANWALGQCGIKGTDDLWAQSFQQWGAALAGYRYGAIVTSMVTSSSGHKRVSHVSFFVRELEDAIITLGYNQWFGSVNYTTIGKENISQIRWPTALNLNSD